MLGIFLAVVVIIAGIVASCMLTALQEKTWKEWKKEWDYYNENPAYRSKPSDDEPDKSKVRLPFFAGVVLAAIIIIVSCLAIVPTGYTGILTTFGRVEDRTISSGANFILPWQKIVKMDNRTQKVQLSTSAFSSDIQQVDVAMSVNYCIDQATAQELYRTVGINYYDNVMFPRIQENTKAVFSQYSAENLIAKRDTLSDQIAEAMANDLKRYGITIVSVAIEDIDFTDAFTNAVEAKQVAAQNKLTAQTEQEQKTMEERAAAERAKIAAQADADKAIIAANADLEVVKVQAEAALYAGEKEAEMNKRISESLTPELTKYKWIAQWDGELPTTILSDDGSYMINLDDIKSSGYKNDGES